MAHQIIMLAIAASSKVFKSFRVTAVILVASGGTSGKAEEGEDRLFILTPRHQGSEWVMTLRVQIYSLHDSHTPLATDLDEIPCLKILLKGW